jgi:predicted alpha/beta-fold hydrolase
MIAASAFRPAWWLPGPHLQTLYPSLVRRRSHPELTRERLELPDGDFLDLDWTRNDGTALVLVLHGLGGSLESPYTGGILQALAAHGYRAVLMYFRGCSGEPNRLARSYHSGETADLRFVIAHLAGRIAPKPLAVIGYSLGGNVLLKALGEHAGMGPVRTGVAVSVPFDLDRAARRLEQGFSRIYQRYLLDRLRRSYRAKASAHTMPVSLARLATLDTFRKFDNEVTAPLHGFRDVDEYYERSSSRQYLHAITTPTLILHAADDPFIPEEAIPGESELGPGVTLELSRRGGHVGFVGGTLPFRSCYWLEGRICAHLHEHLNSKGIRIYGSADP